MNEEFLVQVTTPVPHANLLRGLKTWVGASDFKIP